MSADLQAKYNALLRKFIGDSTLAIDGDTENELSKDIAAAMKEKAKRNAEAYYVIKPSGRHYILEQTHEEAQEQVRRMSISSRSC